MKYQLNLNKIQLAVIQKALEFFSRFCAGQWSIPSSMENMEYRLSDNKEEFWKRRDETNDNFTALKSIFLNIPLNASYGIGSPKLCEEAKIAYDIYRPILEQFAQEYIKETISKGEKPNYSVYDSPGLTYSKEGRIEIKTLEDG